MADYTDEELRTVRDALPYSAKVYCRAVLDAAAPAIVARAKAAALREFAARMESDNWTHRDDCNVKCAYAFEVRNAADEIERGQ